MNKHGLILSRDINKNIDLSVVLQILFHFDVIINYSDVINCFDVNNLVNPTINCFITDKYKHFAPLI